MNSVHSGPPPDRANSRPLAKTVDERPIEATNGIETRSRPRRTVASNTPSADPRGYGTPIRSLRNQPVGPLHGEPVGTSVNEAHDTGAHIREKPSNPIEAPRRITRSGKRTVVALDPWVLWRGAELLAVHLAGVRDSAFIWRLAG